MEEALGQLEQQTSAATQHGDSIQQLQLQALTLHASVSEVQGAALAAERRQKELQGTVAALQVQMEEQRCALEDTQRALARAGCSGGVDEGKVLLKSVSPELLEKLKAAGNLEAVASASGANVSGRYVRAWRSKGREVWNVVVEVTQQERSALIRVAQQVRAAGAVVAPYLTRVGCEMRKEQLKAFEELREKGLRPRWKGGAGITCSGA